MIQRRRGRQGGCPGRHWGRWSLPSTSPVTTQAVNLTTFPFLWWETLNRSVWDACRVCCVYYDFKAWPIVYLSNALTLNMLNYYKDYKSYIHILNRILDLARPKLMQSTLEQQYTLSVLHNQYHACWCSGDFKSWFIVTKEPLETNLNGIRIKVQEFPYKKMNIKFRLKKGGHLVSPQYFNNISRFLIYIWLSHQQGC